LASTAPNGPLALLVSLALAAASCDSAEPRAADSRPIAARSAFDFAARLAQAEIREPLGLVDIGTPAARRLLTSGWSLDAQTPGRSFAWGLGSGSSIDFHLLRARDVPLRLVASAPPYPDVPVQTVSPSVNGHALQPIALDSPRGEYELVLPARALRPGSNRLVFEYAWAYAPRDRLAGQLDDRPLAVAWDALAFDGARRDTPVERVWAEGDSLYLPAGSQVTWYLRAPPDSTVELASLEAPDGADLELEVVVQLDGEPAPRSRRWQPDPAGYRLALDDPGASLARVSFAAVSPAGRRGGGLWLRGAALWTASEQAELADAPTASAAAAASEPPADGEALPNVVIYLVDTLRRDRLGSYGSERGASPHIDRLAQDSIVFDRAVAQAPYTQPSVVSLMTGTDPATHGVLAVAAPLPYHFPTLAEQLRAHGYRTAGFVANAAIRADAGYGRGFDTFIDFTDAALARDRGLGSFPRGHGERAVVDYVLQWLEGDDLREPFFLYVHTIEPHSPYEPPARHRERFASDAGDLGRRVSLDSIRHAATAPTPREVDQLRRLYDAEVAYADENVGKLLGALRERGLYQESLVIFLSDHGEELYERGGLEHGHSLHCELLDIPLLIKPPASRGYAPRRVAGLVRQTDVLPTVLELAGAPPLETAEGRSLVRELRGERVQADERAYSFLELVDHAGASVSTGRWKLVETERPERARLLFDVEHDPEERRDVAHTRPVLAGYLASQLREQLRRTPHDFDPVEVDGRTEEQLRELGYLD
jgi:arylsulfatase A-like enzyme